MFNYLKFLAEDLHVHPQKFINIPTERIASWTEVNDMLGSGLLEYPRIRIANLENPYTKAFCGFSRTSLSERGGKLSRLIPAMIYKSIQDGCTIIIDDCGDFLPGVKQLAAEVQENFGCQAWANLYISPNGKSGFGCHFDDHDILAIQLDGSKTWTIHSPTYHAPDRGDKSFHLPKPNGKPLTIESMNVGEAIYLPFGYWHDVETTSEISLHVTIGMDFVRRADVIQQIAREAVKDKFFRDKLDLAHISEEASSVKKRLIASIERTDFEEILSRLQNRRHPPITKFNLPRISR